MKPLRRPRGNSLKLYTQRPNVCLHSYYWRAAYLIPLLLVFSTVGAPIATAQVETKLVASDASPGDLYGISVSSSEHRALVGAHHNDEGGAESGAAYIYDKTDGEWAEVAKLVASDASEQDFFGISVSLSGERALIGAFGDEGFKGAAYIFELQGGLWTETAKLTASDAVMDDRFGRHVTLLGDRALISSERDDDGGTNSGSAYLFELQGGAWVETAKMTASDPAPGDLFGISVSLSEEYALVGALYDDDGGSNSGSAYLFELATCIGTCHEVAKLTASDAAGGDVFGWNASIFGDLALIGAQYDDDQGTNSGAAYIFDLSTCAGLCNEMVKLTASDAAAGDEFGSSVALVEERAVVGAFGDASFSGAAYVFERQAGLWTETQKLTASDAAPGDYFGVSVALAQGQGIVGAYFDDDAGGASGSAYLYDFDPAPYPTVAYAPSLESHGDIRFDHRHNQARIYWTNVLGVSSSAFVKPASKLDGISTPVAHVLPGMGTTEVGGGEGYGVRGPAYAGAPSSADKLIDGYEHLTLALNPQVVSAGAYATGADIRFRASNGQGATIRIIAFRHREAVADTTYTVLAGQKPLASFEFDVPFDALQLTADSGAFAITNPSRLFIHTPDQSVVSPWVALFASRARNGVAMITAELNTTVGVPVSVEVTGSDGAMYALVIPSGDRSVTVEVPWYDTYTITALDDPSGTLAVARSTATSSAEYHPEGFVSIQHRHNKVLVDHGRFGGTGKVVIKPASGRTQLDASVFSMTAYRDGLPAEFEVGGGEGIGVKGGESPKYIDTNEAIVLATSNAEAVWSDVHFKFKAPSGPAVIALTMARGAIDLALRQVQLEEGGNAYTLAPDTLFDSIRLEMVSGVASLQHTTLYGTDLSTTAEKQGGQHESFQSQTMAMSDPVSIFPNPFNPSTTIRFGLPKQTHVRLVVYDVLGRERVRLQDGVLSAGRHSIRFDASGLPTGTYLYRLRTPEGDHVGRMQLLK